MSLFKFKNKINSHVVFNNTVKQIAEEIQKIPKYNDLKGNPEIVLMVCNCVENIITKKECNKKELVKEIMKIVFNLNDVEIKTIECFWSNNMIVKIKRIQKVGKLIGSWFYRKFL